MKEKKPIPDAGRAPTTRAEEQHGTMTIGALSTATGVPTATIRIWERRYGKPTPARLPSGHRRYNESHVRWLRRMVDAISRGHPPSFLTALSEGELDRLIEPQDQLQRDEPELKQLLRLVREFRAPQLRASLVQLGERLGPLAFLRDRAMPLLRHATCPHSREPLGARHVRFLVHVLQDALYALRQALPEPTGKRTLLLGALPDDGHDLGQQMVGLLCALNRVPTVSVGDLAHPELLLAVEELAPFGVCMWIANVLAPATLERRLLDLRRSIPPRIALLTAGSCLRTLRRGMPDIECFSTLDDLELRLRSLAL